jgi:hypothetical protein
VGFTALSAIAPALDKISAAAVGIVEAFNGFLAANPRIAQAVAVIATGAIAGAVAIAALTGAVILFGVAASAMATAWTVATAAMGAASAVMAIIASPIGIIVGLVAGLAIALTALGATLLLTTATGQTALAGLEAGFHALWATVTQVMGGILDAFAVGDFALAGAIVMAALELAWIAGFGKLRKITAEGISSIHSTILRGVEGLEIPFLTGAARTIRAGIEMGAKGIADDTARELEAASKTLDDLTAKAAANRKKREDALKVPAAAKREGGDASPDVGAIDAGKAAQAAMRGYTGTFSATVAGRLGMTSKVDDEIAQNTLDAANALIEINRKVKAGTLVVAR